MKPVRNRGSVREPLLRRRSGKAESADDKSRLEPRANCLDGPYAGPCVQGGSVPGPLAEPLVVGWVVQVAQDVGGVDRHLDDQIRMALE